MTIGIDATTPEANAALRSIVRQRGWRRNRGIATPTREQLAKLDRGRARKGSNEDWVNPHRSGGADHEAEGRRTQTWRIRPSMRSIWRRER
jgi:hypothetical protein